MLKQKILIIEDDKALAEAISDTLELNGYATKIADCAENCLKILSEDTEFSMIVSDVNLGAGLNGIDLLKHLKELYPQIPVLIITAYSNIEDAVTATKIGAVNYLAKPFVPESLLSLVARYAVTVHPEREPIAYDKVSKQLLAITRRVAKSNITVLLEGESGTGKEVYARFIHRNSQCSQGPFVAINCAAIPENMLEAILFGYEKGAFTGALQSTAGKFELANKGTILLDEVSEMPLALQAKLLRVIQEREVERLASKKAISLDVRIIATTNRNLKEYVKEGAFREDLYFRLSVFPIEIPPLRARKDDILPLANSVLQQIATEQQQPMPILEQSAISQLLNYSWPGNIRELQNCLQRAYILQGQNISFMDVVETALDEDVGQTDGDTTPLKEQEYKTIIKVLREHHGCRKTTASSLGISSRTLRHKIAKMKEIGYVIPKSERVARGDSV